MVRPNQKQYPLRWVIIVGALALVGGGLVGYLVSGGNGPVYSAVPAPASARPSPAQIMPFGQTAKASTGNTITPVSFTVGQVKNWPPPPEGYGFSQLEIRYCNAADGPQVALRDLPRFFLMYEADRTAVSAEQIWHNADELTSQGPALLKPGECVKGKIVFLGPTTSVPASLEFSGASSFEWDLPPTAPVPSSSSPFSSPS